MAVEIPFLASRRAVEFDTADMHHASVRGLLEDIYSGDMQLAPQASARLARLLEMEQPSLHDLTLEQWERFLFPIKFSDDSLANSMFGVDLQIQILRALARGGYVQGIICARFASYRARHRKVRRAARECVAALEGLREQPAGNLARVIG